ncbi:hypothetical protein BJV78DRAFT_1229805 [Lactifluus subvellereus]|nr:hypothetical protein BJV78DRAFT_1229805 [Lactifluus subvellereus]
MNLTSPAVSTAAPHFVPFHASQKSAAITVFVFALLSTFVLSFVLLSVVWILLSSTFKRTSHLNLTREAFFFRSQLGQFAGCLLLSNWIKCVSGLISIQWIIGGGVTAGTSCVAQGVLGQIGQFGTSFFIVIMGTHTFRTLVLRNRQPQWVGIVVTIIGWAAALAIGAGPLAVSADSDNPVYSITGIACGFSKSYGIAHMLLFFLPLFLASLLSAIVYSLIFLILRGTLTINGGLRIQLDPERRLRPRSGTFEEYQRFIYSVARTMLWLPISFVVTLFPSSIVQLMVISGIGVSPEAMAFSDSLEYLEGVLNVLILFNVLRALGPAMRSTSTPVCPDTEKGRMERGTVSRPADDWKPQSTFAPPTQDQAMRTASQAHPPITILHGLVPSRSSSKKSLHKKADSATSTTRLLTPPDSESPSPCHSPTPSLGTSELSVSPALIPKSIASVSDAELALPPQALQKVTHTNPQLHLLTPSSQSNSNVTGLTPCPRVKRSRVSSDLGPIPGSPATITAPQTTLPVVEAAPRSPAASVSPTDADVGSVVNLYFSDAFASSVDSPLSPAPAIPTNGSADLPISILESTVHVSPTTPLPATSSIDHSLVVPPEGATRPLKAYVSVGAVGGGRRPTDPDTHLVSPADSRDASQYSDSEASPPSQPPYVIPPLQPTQPLRLSRSTSISAQAGAEMDRQTFEQPRVPRPVHHRQTPRSLPTLPGLPNLTRTPTARLQTRSALSTRSRKAASRSSHRGYL